MFILIPNGPLSYYVLRGPLQSSINHFFSRLFHPSRLHVCFPVALQMMGHSNSHLVILWVQSSKIFLITSTLLPIVSPLDSAIASQPFSLSALQLLLCAQSTFEEHHCLLRIFQCRLCWIRGPCHNGFLIVLCFPHRQIPWCCLLLCPVECGPLFPYPV